MNFEKSVLWVLCLVALVAGCNKPGTTSGEKKAAPTPPSAAPAHTTDSK
jgi:hypothetical protein